MHILFLKKKNYKNERDGTHYCLLMKQDLNTKIGTKEEYIF